MLEIKDLELLSNVLGTNVERFSEINKEVVVFPDVMKFNSYELAHYYKIFINQNGKFEVTITQRDETLVRVSIYDCHRNILVLELEERDVLEVQQVIRCCEMVIDYENEFKG